MVFGLFKNKKSLSDIDAKYASDIKSILIKELGQSKANAVSELDWVVAAFNNPYKDKWSAAAMAAYIITRTKYEPKNNEEAELHQLMNETLEAKGINWKQFDPDMYWTLVGVAIKSCDPEFAVDWFFNVHKSFMDAHPKSNKDEILTYFKEQAGELIDILA